MTFSHHKEGVVMSSQITPIQSSNALPLTHIPARHLCLDFQLLRPVHSLTPPAHVTASHLQVIIHQSDGGRSERMQVKQKWPHIKLNHHMRQGCLLLHIFRSFSSSIFRHPSICYPDHLHAIHPT